MTRAPRRATKASRGSGILIAASLREDPPQVLVDRAQQCARAGQLAEAARLYRRILRIAPRASQAMHGLGVLAYQQGDNAAAIDWLRRAVSARAGSAMYHRHLGEALRSAGRCEEALQSYGEALALDATDADTHYGLGNALFELGRFADAAVSYQAAVHLNPLDAEAHNNLGNAQSRSGDPAGAEASYRQALEIQPGYIDSLVNLASVLTETGRADAAILYCLQALALDPHRAEAHLAYGNALRAQNRLAEAISSYRQAVAAYSSFVAAHMALGRTLIDLRRFEEALVAFEAARSLDPQDVSVLNGLARTLLFLNRPDWALRILKEAEQISPDNAETHLNRGICLQLRGEFDAARAALKQATALAPGMGEAHHILSLSEHARADENEIRRMEELLAGPFSNANERAPLHYALAKLYDDLGRYDNAFRHLERANRLRDAEFGVPVEPHIDFVDRVIGVFTAELLEALAGFGSNSELPVFIVGMPRSGTTLVEQILASHPRVFGAGELGLMQDITRRFATMLEPPTSYPDCVSLVPGAVLNNLAREYLSALRDRCADADRITDKLPGNYLRLGLIALLFPRARVIHCRRDPLDTCLSCYFQNFGRNQPLFADLRKLGTVYRQYERIMEHWRAVLPILMLEVRYEELIDNHERVSRRMIEFCGLPWDDRCLQFHRTERPVNTASFWQVRQPIYSSSLRRWRNYEPYLAPLKAALGWDTECGSTPAA